MWGQGRACKLAACVQVGGGGGKGVGVCMRGRRRKEAVQQSAVQCKDEGVKKKYNSGTGMPLSSSSPKVYSARVIMLAAATVPRR